MQDQERVSRRQLAAWTVVGGACLAVLIAASIRWAPGPQHARDYPSRTLPPQPEPVLIAADEPDPDYYPCSDCHEDEPTDRTVRALEYEHDDIELDHGDLWCLHCHEADDRDVLHLADGRTTSYEDSWRLCTQCHGQKLADWRAGVHGRRVGHWWGPKQYQTCVSCHRPHSPVFAPIEPRPPPTPPERSTRHARAPAPEVSDE